MENQKQIQIFNNPEFGEIRSMEIGGEPWFVGKDVAAAYGAVYPFMADEGMYAEVPEDGMSEFAVSCDYGTVNPTSMGLWGKKDGVWYRVDEYYFDSRREGFQKTDEEHYAALQKLAEGRKLRQVVINPSAASFIEVIRRHGEFRVTPAQNNVINGIRRVSDALKEGRIKICKSCAAARREFQLYRWDSKGVTDAPVKEHDHAMDDIRYFVTTAIGSEPPQTVNEAELKLINAYTRKELSAEDVYAFTVVLCDNDVDRDGERFTVESLFALEKLFVGKTGIMNHNPSAQNQKARIFACRVESVPGRVTATGDDYFRLTARAYMPKTEDNRSLIDAIDSGIVKEVSVGCAVEKTVCSICGEEQGLCAHQKGERYSGKLCCGELQNPLDAYEWSFVAVPAQKTAGVVKSAAGKDRNLKYHQRRRELCKICEKVRNFSCGTPRCPLDYPCAVFGNPHTTDAAGIKAMYQIYQYEQNKKSES